MSVAVRAPRHGEALALTRLYRESFGPRHPGRSLRPRFTFDDTLVAEIDGELAGFACAERAQADIDPQLACLEHGERGVLEGLAALDAPAVEILAPEGTTWARGPRDLVVTAVAVEPGHRRRGVARALVEAWCAWAASAEWRRVYAHCVDGSGSREVFEAAGFTPLVHFARHYADGAGMSLVARDVG